MYASRALALVSSNIHDWWIRRIPASIRVRQRAQFSVIFFFVSSLNSSPTGIRTYSAACQCCIFFASKLYKVFLVGLRFGPLVFEISSFSISKSFFFPASVDQELFAFLQLLKPWPRISDCNCIFDCPLAPQTRHSIYQLPLCQVL